MKKIISAALFVLFLSAAQAQNYMIDFTGAGASSSVDSVKIENLTQCTSLLMGGADILNLSSVTGIDQFVSTNSDIVNIYPNPSPGYFILEIASSSDNFAGINIYDVSGRSVFEQGRYLKKGYHKFYIDGIPRGVYIFTVESELYQYASKIICNAVSENLPEMKMLELSENPDVIKSLQKTDNKGGKSVISMLFNFGDTLKLSGKSGIYRTVMMLFPTGDQTVTFNFVDCTDAEGNHYAVVQIGTLLWMAENLKTRKYRDGSDITNVPDSATWGSTLSGAYCDFHNDTNEGNNYGRLYNFYAVADVRNIAPVGWHVASNYEWNIMEKFLDPTVDTSSTVWMSRGRTIGRILKESCNTRWAYMDTTSGWNSAGFTALCTNFRNSVGSWSMAPNNDHDDGFWTSTAYSANTAWNLSLRWCYGNIYVMPLANMRAGSSIRCVKDP